MKKSRNLFRNLDIRLYFYLESCMMCFRIYFNEVEKKNRVQFDEAVIREAEEKDFEECNAINNEWNIKVAKIRENRLAEVKKRTKENILQNLLKQEQQQEEKRKKIDEQIRKAKQDAVSFITPDNIDAAIEECLTNIVNHNRALDLEGNWYDGKYLQDPSRETPVVAEQSA